MKIINLIWGFSLGAGIDKCYLTYARLGEIDPSVEVESVCIRIGNKKGESEILEELGVRFIDILNKRDFSWLGKLAALIRSSNPDVVFTHGFNGAIMMYLEKKLKRIDVPFVCSYHGKYHAPTVLKRLVSPLYNSLPIRIYRKHVKKIVCVENISRKHLIKNGVPEEKIFVVHNGIQDVSEIKTNSYSKACEIFNIISVSSLFPVKGLNYLIDSISIITQKTLLPICYTVIGNGPEESVLKNMVNDLNLEDVVKFAGYQEDIIHWQSNADIYVLPSLSEAHSIALLEAMRAGKAIVATNVGGNPESLRDGIDGILVPPANSEALADAILYLIEHPEDREKFGKSARQRFLDNFTEEVMQKKLIEVLKK